MARGSKVVVALAALAGSASAALGDDITRPGDFITPSSGASPPGEQVQNAIDNTARTKYLNFDRLNTGFTVLPSGAGVVNYLTIVTANDSPERDPTSFTLEGSFDNLDFTLLAQGPLTPPLERFAIASAEIPGNMAMYPYYRVLFPTIRGGAANSMQVAEVQLATEIDITSRDDSVMMLPPPGGFTAPNEGVGNLLDNRANTKFNVQNATGGPTLVNITPLAGATIVRGLSFFSGSDDAAFPGRSPRNITLSGSNDGVNYTQIFTTPIAQATDNMQDQEFAFFNTTAYTRYRLEFDGPHFASDMQMGEIQLFGSLGDSTAPPNDDCANAEVIAAGPPVSGTTALGTGADITPCGNNDAIDVWYRYNAGSSGLVQVDTCESATDTTLAVYSSCGGALLACDDNGCFLRSIARFNAAGGQSYLIRVALTGGATGSFRVRVTENPPVHTDTPIALNYNFNGMVHQGEAGDPDSPNGYRSISDRGLIADNADPSIGAGTIVGRTGIVYDIARKAGALDIVHLGNRNTVDSGNWAFDVAADGDDIGVRPDWLPNPDQTGPQVAADFQTILMADETRLGFLYQISNGGGSFDATLTFDDTSSATVQLQGPDWFFDQHPGPPSAGVESQLQLGLFAGAANVDRADASTPLNVVEAIVSSQSLLNAGFGDFRGRRLVSITIANRSNLVAGYALVAVSARDAGVSCPCDWDNSGAVNSQDFFNFLNGFFAGNADFNNDGITNSQDFFDFLNCFFNPQGHGCP